MWNNEYFQRAVFFIVLALVVFGAPLVVFAVTSDPATRTVVAFLSTLILVLGFQVATFAGISDNRVRLTVMITAAGFCFAALQFQQHLDAALEFLINVVVRT